MFFLIFLWLSMTTCVTSDLYIVNITLNDLIFRNEISNFDTSLVMFYSYFCGDCQDIGGHFLKAALELLYSKPTIGLFQVDCLTTGLLTCEMFNIGLNYPTLKIFRYGRYLQDYDGPKDHAGFVGYMKAYFTSNVKELKSIEEFTDFVYNSTEVCVVGQFSQKSGSEKAFMKTVEVLKTKAKFGILKFGENEDAIVLYRPYYLHNKFESNSITYSGHPNWEKIATFITRNYYGLVGHRQLHNAEHFQRPLIVVYCQIDYVHNTKEIIYTRNKILKVAATYQKVLTFAFSSKSDFKNELQYYGIDFVVGDSTPLTLAIDDGGYIFLMEEPLTVKNLHSFVEDFLNKRLTRYMKSEAIPEQNSGPVKVVVAKNFEELVLDSERDAMVAFYTSWCRYSRMLQPVYAEFGKKMEYEDVDIFKLNVSANGIPQEYGVQGFPAVLWFPKGSKNKPVGYTDGPTLGDLIKFVAKYATKELKGYDREGRIRRTKSEL